MKNSILISKVFLLAAFVLVFAEKPAHAYLDAATGSMVIQLLLAGTAGLAVMRKVLWQRILNLFGLSRSEEE